MARKQVRLDPAKIEAEAKAALDTMANLIEADAKANLIEADANAAEVPPAPPPVVIVPDAPPESMPDAPAAAPSATADEAPSTIPAPAYPKPVNTPYIQKRYRVMEDIRFALYGMTMNWRVGRMLDSNGYDITYLRSIGVKMQEV